MNRDCFIVFALLPMTASSALAQSPEVPAALSVAPFGVPETSAVEDDIQLDVVDYLRGALADGSLGLIDVGEAASLAAGIIDVYPTTRTQLSANGDTSGFLQAELSHGSRYVRHIVMAGANPFYSDTAPVFGGGLGGVIVLGPYVDLSVDGLFRLRLPDLDQGTYDLLPGLRVTVAVAIAPSVAVTVGASYTVQVTNDAYTPDYGNLLGFVHAAWDGSKTVRSYLSFSLGLRFF